MTQSAIGAIFISFAVTGALCPIAIPLLRRLKFGQQVRDDGPESHLKKSGTPTMGGLMILAGFALGAICFSWFYPRIVPVLLVTLGFGLIGFMDDYIKIVRKRSKGLDPKQKLIGQFIITGIFAWYLVGPGGVGTSILVPFTGGLGSPAVSAAGMAANGAGAVQSAAGAGAGAVQTAAGALAGGAAAAAGSAGAGASEPGLYFDLGWLYIPFVFLVMLGTDNGVNFTDGLDGLCCSVTVPVAAFFAIVALQTGDGAGVASGAVIGSLLGFLLFNAYPAKVFMGDTGALALGGFVASMALMLRMGLFILAVGLVYLVEVLSVMAQVTYFKRTGGKRIFKMAPIHHHFELCGWSETQVVTVFSVVTALLCLASYAGLAR
ncbi:MAG: phospho-N-acetylmuramoyl-pentapeptide-transferase [Lachnospiraceae bacterium]|jgi:phospho-N-acetylmuramoyl-pentapeptide-transferase|nr:phospho-N-acetylmuramoyl-pentapeptide-transferase [Lachnospiraceae bacterium]